MTEPLQTGLAPCACGGKDYPGLIRQFGKCRHCVTHELNSSRRLGAAIREAIDLADTGTTRHKAAFDPHGAGTVPPGWRVAERMRDVLAGAAGALPD